VSNPILSEFTVFAAPMAATTQLPGWQWRLVCDLKADLKLAKISTG
jgi:hypothetical protein